MPFFIALFLLCLAQQSDAQKKLNQGKAIFDITYPDAELDEQTLAMMPTQSTLYFKDQFSRTEMKIAMGTTIVITDGKSGVATMLMDMMGNKIAMKTTKADIEKEKKKIGKIKTVVKITGETKTIAGYLCKKAEITIKMKDSSDVKSSVWFTNEISAPNSMRSGGGDFEEIDGFMMEYQTQMDKLTMKMTCMSAIETTVSDSLFTIPPGYTVTTMDDLKEMMGGAH